MQPAIICTGCRCPRQGCDGAEDVTQQAPAHNGQPAIRVFILDDHELVGLGLKELLEGHDFTVVGSSGSAAEATRVIPALRPDVSVLDARLPDGTGIEVCRDVRSVDPSLKCLILTSYDDEQALRGAVLAGAAGYVLKEIGGTDLLTAIKDAARGGSLFDSELKRKIVEGLSEPAPLDKRVATEKTVRTTSLRCWPSLGSSDGRRQPFTSRGNSRQGLGQVPMAHEPLAGLSRSRGTDQKPGSALHSTIHPKHPVEVQRPDLHVCQPAPAGGTAHPAADATDGDAQGLVVRGDGNVDFSRPCMSDGIAKTFGHDGQQLLSHVRRHIGGDGPGQGQPRRERE